MVSGVVLFEYSRRAEFGIEFECCPFVYPFFGGRGEILKKCVYDGSGSPSPGSCIINCNDLKIIAGLWP